jgi:hypothetical protein
MTAAVCSIARLDVAVGLRAQIAGCLPDAPIQQVPLSPGRVVFLLLPLLKPEQLVRLPAQAGEKLRASIRSDEFVERRRLSGPFFVAEAKRRELNDVTTQRADIATVGAGRGLLPELGNLFLRDFNLTPLLSAYRL